jgi:hypothetical protein
MSEETPDDPPLPYTVHETFLGGGLGDVVSRLATLDQAILAATARLDRSCAIVFRRQIVWPPVRTKD